MGILTYQEGFVNMDQLKFEVSQVAGNISYNLDAVKELAESKVNLYKGIVVTDDTTKSAKEDIAELRKFQKDIDTARKQVKKEYIRPLDEFEDRCKEVIALLEGPIQYMDKQVKEYELQKKQEKKEEISKLYAELTKEYTDYLTLSKYYKPQWENSATSKKSIEKDITALVDQVSMAVAAIKATESEFVDKGLESLKDSLDVSKAMMIIKGYEAQKREILEREEKRKRDEEKRKQREEEARIKAEEEARKKAEYEKQMEIEAEQELIKIAEEAAKHEAEQFIDEEPFTDEEPFSPVIEELPFIQEPKLVKKIYFIEETELTHSEIEEELIRMGVAFESEVM